MKIEVILQNRETGKIYELSDIVGKLSLSSYLEIKPGKAEIELNVVNKIDWLSLGSLVSIKINDKKMFFGYVFKFDYDEEHKVCITAYDQLRYLAFKDTFMLDSMSSSKVFETICQASSHE